MNARKYPMVFLGLLLCALVLNPGSSRAQLYIEEEITGPITRSEGFYMSFGMGFIRVDEGTGINVPFGLQLVSRRLIGTIRLLDIGLLQGDDRDPRYFRGVDRFSGYWYCYDSQTFLRVSEFRCSSGTDVLSSLNVDLSFVPVETLFFADRPGKIFIGPGFRLVDPKTFYGTIGILFDAGENRTGGLKVTMGRDYVSFGISWGLHVRSLRRFF